jgi:hypothetical protein
MNSYFFSCSLLAGRPQRKTSEHFSIPEKRERLFGILRLKWEDDLVVDQLPGNAVVSWSSRFWKESPPDVLELQETQQR